MAGAIAAAGAAGAAVVVIGRDTATLTATVDKISAEGGRAAFVAADLDERSSAWRATEEAVALFGEPDILVEPPILPTAGSSGVHARGQPIPRFRRAYLWPTPHEAPTFGYRKRRTAVRVRPHQFRPPRASRAEPTATRAGTSGHQSPSVMESARLPGGC